MALIKGVMFKVNRQTGTFSVLNNGVREYFYLAKPIKEVFCESIHVGCNIEFVTGESNYVDKRVRYNEVSQVISLSAPFTPRPLYHKKKIDEQLLNVFLKTRYFLVIDFEFSIGPWGDRKFISEIIQAGYVLLDNQGNIIEENSLYLKTRDQKELNKRIFRMIHIKAEDYYVQAIPYLSFYQHLAEIMDKYNPKLVYWGPSDKDMLKSSFSFNKVASLVPDGNYLNLQLVHRNYYGTKIDLGLYAAYTLYGYLEEIQDHNALHDAQKTYEILFFLIDRLKDKLEDKPETSTETETIKQEDNLEKPKTSSD